MTPTLDRMVSVSHAALWLIGTVMLVEAMVVLAGVFFPVSHPALWLFGFTLLVGAIEVRAGFVSLEALTRWGVTIVALVAIVMTVAR